MNGKSQSSTSSNPLPRITLDPTPEEKTINSGSGATSEFEATAARLEEKYSAGEGAPGAEPEPEVIPPDGAEPPPRGVVSDATMRLILARVFAGLEKTHGAHWHLEAEDLDLLSPINVDAVNEWAALVGFTDSRYKATIAWSVVMALFIASRSKAGALLLEKLAEAISRLFTFGKSNTSGVSPESPGSSHRQDTEKPS